MYYFVKRDDDRSRVILNCISQVGQVMTWIKYLVIYLSLMHAPYT